MESLANKTSRVVLENYQLPKDLTDEIFKPQLVKNKAYDMIEMLIFLDSIHSDVVISEGGNMFFKVIPSEDLEKEFPNMKYCWVETMKPYKGYEFYFAECDNVGSPNEPYDSITVIKNQKSEKFFGRFIDSKEQEEM